MEPSLIVSICSSGIALFCAIITFLVYKNDKKQHMPIIKVNACIKETYKNFRESMGPSYAFIVRAENIGQKHVRIDHPLVMKAVGLLGRDLTKPKVILNYERNVNELPYELHPESFVDFQISKDEVKNNLMELSGCFRIIWVINDTLDRKYESNKIKVKIFKNDLIIKKKLISNE